MYIRMEFVKEDKMKKYDNIIIGFGKAGKTLAGLFASKGESTLIVEKSEYMYGGTCINIACLPTKTLENLARESKLMGGGFEEKAKRYTEAVEFKDTLISKLRTKNYDKAVSAGVEVVVGTASFEDSHTINVKTKEDEFKVYGERIVINTGARSFIPPIEGINSSEKIYTSTSLMSLKTLPRKLVVVGGGFIGLEFASYYTNFGSEVLVLQDQPVFIPREDDDIRAAVEENLDSRGIKILKSVKIEKFVDTDSGVEIHYEIEGTKEIVSADAVLVATGRVPNTEGLNLSAAGVEVGSRGEVVVDEHLKTSVDHIYAVGDVKGGLQFTYISLDDFRIIKDSIYGDGSRTTENRGHIPFSVFIDPPLARVGMTQAEAIEKGYFVKVGKLPVAAVPKANVIKKPEGLMKVIIDEKTGYILGAHLFAPESHEIINIIKLAMDQNIPYTVLRDSIYTHPTIVESFNDLFAI